MEILIYVGKSAGILSIFYLIYIVVLRKDTFFTANRHFMLSGIAAALVLPFIEFTKQIYVEAPSSMLLETIPTPIYSEVVSQPVVSQFTIDWWQVGLLVYLIGCILLLVQLFVQLISLLKLIKKYPAIKRPNYTFVEVDKQISPFSFFNYVVYNPALHSETELSMILAHEKVHAKQRHSVDILLANVIRIIQWVNPLSWMYKKSLEENLEFIADVATVQVIPSKKEYQLALVKASSTLYAPALTVQFYQSFIKKRIIMLNKSNSNKYNQLKLSLIIPFLALFLWSFNVKEKIAYTEIETPVQGNLNVIENNKPAAVAEAIKTPIKEAVKTPAKVTAERTVQATVNSVPSTTGTMNNQGLLALATPKNPLESPKTVSLLSSMLANGYKFVITSKTTDAELEAFKSEVKKDHDINLNYSVNRNNQGEITSLSINYSGKGSNGSFNINDDKPIEDFYFYVQENGDTGFWSGKHTKHHQKRMLKRAEEMEERHEAMEARMAERMEIREIEMEERQEEMEERRVEMEERRSEMAERMEQRREHMEKQKHKMQEEHEKIVHRNKRSNQVRSIHRGSDSQGSHSIILDSNTSDATLAKMKANLKAKGVSFSYSKLKRNSAGKITRIRVDVDNNNGSKQSIFSKTDDGEPIDDMIIEF